MTYTSDVDTMRAIHEYNRSHYRTTPVQTNALGVVVEWGWTGATLLDTDGGEWLIQVANGDRSRLRPELIRMGLGR